MDMTIRTAECQASMKQLVLIPQVRATDNTGPSDICPLMTGVFPIWQRLYSQEQWTATERGWIAGRKLQPH
jgi:hypothetical protein